VPADGDSAGTGRVARERRMKEVLGVRVAVELHDRGALDRYTGTSQTSKVKRLLDRRK
jgi:phenylacetate-coenzyme A ligase PaaK-like adenylate-forming protein